MRPITNAKHRWRYLFKDAVFRKTNTHTAPMQILAVRIRKEETRISFTPKSPSLFFKSAKRMKKVTMPEIEVAKARPAIFKGNMSIVFKIILRMSAREAIFVGVTVSLSAKKQDCRILFAP